VVEDRDPARKARGRPEAGSECAVQHLPVSTGQQEMREKADDRVLERVVLPAGEQEGAEGCKAVPQGRTPPTSRSWDPGTEEFAL
jgi:hypothetical protein